MTLNAELKARWLAALRSGEYKQGKGYLRDTFEGTPSYCCLGVLCDITGAKWTDSPTEGVSRAGFTSPLTGDVRWSSNLLPHTLAGLLGIDTSPAPMADLWNLRTPGGKPLADLSLANLNDDDMTFDQIADVIEYFM